MQMRRFAIKARNTLMEGNWQTRVICLDALHSIVVEASFHLVEQWRFRRAPHYCGASKPSGACEQRKWTSQQKRGMIPGRILCPSFET